MREVVRPRYYSPRNRGRRRLLPRIVRLLTGSILVAAAVVAASAQPIESPSRWDVAFGSAFVSDYNYRGITVSGQRPSVIAYVEPRYKLADRLEAYAGLNSTSIQLPNGSPIQMYYYAGVRSTFDALSLDFALAYVDY